MGAMPASRRREMFSITTMASSTTNPVAIVSAISERLSMLNPHRYITANVPISEAGTATVGMSVARQLRRNTKTTRITSMTDRISVRSTSLTDARMVVVRSRTMVVLMPCGIDASIDGNAALMRSTVSMMLAPGWRKMIIGIERHAVQVARRANVLRGVLNVGHIGQPDRGAVVIPHNQRLVLVRMAHLVVDHNIRGRDSVGKLPGRLVRILLAQHRLNIRQCQPVAVEQRRIHFHAHRRAGASAHRHLPHALDLR